MSDKIKRIKPAESILKKPESDGKRIFTSPDGALFRLEILRRLNTELRHEFIQKNARSEQQAWQVFVG